MKYSVVKIVTVISCHFENIMATYVPVTQRLIRSSSNNAEQIILFQGSDHENIAEIKEDNAS